MAKNITGRITVNLVAGIAITVVTIAAAIFWMAAKQDEQAAQSTNTMVLGGVDAMARRVKSLAYDYGWWEDAYEAYVRQDSEWFWANVGSSVVDTQIADLMAIISPSGTLDYGWVQDTDKQAADVITPAAIEAIRALVRDLPVENLVSRSSYLRSADGVFMIAVSRITPVSRAHEVEGNTLPIYLAGFALSPERLQELGLGFLIDDLRLELVQDPQAPQVSSDVSDEAASFPPVVDIFGDTIGHYVWTPPRPGNAVLRSVLPPIIVALVIFCIVAFVTAFRARKIAIALTESEKEASIAARTDGMTGLKNRTGFNELLDSPLYQTACKSGELAVIYLDINGFKAVNDSIGHNGGDELVKALTVRLRSVLPPDALFARIGGDEFAVALMGRSVRDTAAGAASAIVHSLDQPFTVHGFEFHVTVAVGYAVAGGTGLTPSEIVRRADIAMYHAKNGAEREAVAYHSTMETGALEKKQVEIALRRAVEEGDLQVHYQPVVRSSDLSIVGVEALVRWTSREFGTVSPSLFIPVAEETGLIHDVGRLVVDRACQDMLKWPGLKMAVNISPVQLRDPNFADDILGVVERYGLSPHQFELELTEGILVNNPTIAKRKLAHLKTMGFTLSLDDFGTGFSSIGYLRQFPFDVLKVDRSFVRDLGINSTANALVQSLVSLGDAMDLSVIAEGIENEDQLKLLRLVQCEYLQGFLISRPLPATELVALLERLGPERRFLIGREPERRAAAS